MWIEKVPVQRIQNFDKIKKNNDAVCTETCLDLILNDSPSIPIYATGTSQQELGIGYVIFNRLANFNDTITADIDGSTIHVRTTKGQADENSPASTPLAKPEPIRREHIYKLMAYFQEQSMLYRQTAVTESAAFADINSLTSFAEDLNDTQSIYKILGKTYLANIQKNLAETQEEEEEEEEALATPLSQSFIAILSFKISMATIQKLHQFGIRVMISRVGPTSSALNYAKEHNLTIIGFSRNKKFTVYSNPLKELIL